MTPLNDQIKRVQAAAEELEWRLGSIDAPIEITFSASPLTPIAIEAFDCTFEVKAQDLGQALSAIRFLQEHEG